MAAWHSLYLPSDDTTAIHDALKTALATHNYTFYDPFNAMTPGAIYARAVKLFIAPPRAGWTRILVAPDAPPAAEILALASSSAPLLVASLTRDQARIMAFRNVDEENAMEILTAHLRENRTPDDLRRALYPPPEHAETRKNDDSLPPLDVLPDDVREMAASLDTKQVNKLFGKMMRKVNRIVGGEQAAAARALIDSGPDWESSGGRRIRGVMACLTVPDGWHTPDFVTLRDAYRLHLRHRERPEAPSMPGDEATMAQVPDALDYMPVYAGKVND